MLCPHCGANREGMTDEQPCWRCKRLPIAPRPLPTPPVRGRKARSSGSNRLPLLLGLGVVCFFGASIAFLILRDTNTPRDNEVQIVATTTTPLAETDLPTDVLPTTTPPPIGTVSSTLPPAPPVMVGDAAATLIAERTLIPTPTLAPILTATLAPTFTPVEAVLAQCADVLPSRLRVGDAAEVIVRDGIRLRANPSTDGLLVQTLAFGTHLTLISSTQCAEGYWWWFVQLEDSDTTGWVAEGDAERYFLQSVP